MARRILSKEQNVPEDQVVMPEGLRRQESYVYINLNHEEEFYEAKKHNEVSIFVNTNAYYTPMYTTQYTCILHIFVHMYVGGCNVLRVRRLGRCQFLRKSSLCECA
jgi:hypothetical protein